MSHFGAHPVSVVTQVSASDELAEGAVHGYRVTEKDDLGGGNRVGVYSDEVFAVVRRIPKGMVSTYGQVARLIGKPRSARYVGYALRNNPSPGSVIPCHRVVFKDGQLSPGFAFGGSDVQRVLLEEEGVTFLDDMHVDIERCLWNPEADGQGRPADIDWAREIGDE